MSATKYVFVTGGVVSSLGKGITAASLGAMLKARGIKVGVQKFDPYINVDPGTMSPFQHGEVFVTEDGAETDLDIGHYERFLDQNLSATANHTAGAVLRDENLTVLERAHRAGVDVDVRVELLDTDLDPARLQHRPERGRGDPLAERRDNPARDEYVLDRAAAHRCVLPSLRGVGWAAVEEKPAGARPMTAPC